MTSAKKQSSYADEAAGIRVPLTNLLLRLMRFFLYHAPFGLAVLTDTAQIRVPQHPLGMNL